MWHASVCILDRRTTTPIPLAEMNPVDAKRAQALCIDLLSGVGRSPDLREVIGSSYHLRRRLNLDELAQLDPEWCAIPARDLGGSGKPW